jgi:hypothetical protein
MIEPTTALTLSLMHWKSADLVTLADRARMLAAAGEAYLRAEAEGRVPPREARRYTSQLAHAARNCCQADRPHLRDQALGPIEEIEALSAAELAAERDAIKKKAQATATEPAEAQPLDENRYDVRQGLVG